MKPKQILKIVIDVAMTVLLLLLMAYSLVGEAAHEWLGVAMFVLFVTHHVLNSGWCRSLFKGRYPPLRVFQTALFLLDYVAVMGLFVCIGHYAAKGLRKLQQSAGRLAKDKQ